MSKKALQDFRKLHASGSVGTRPDEWLARYNAAWRAMDAEEKTAARGEMFRRSETPDRVVEEGTVVVIGEGKKYVGAGVA